MAKSKFLSGMNKFLDKFTEVVPEVADDGLLEDTMVNTKEIKRESFVDQLEKGAKKALSISKQEDDNEEVCATETNSLTQLLKTTPETQTDTIEEVQAVQETEEKAPVAQQVIEVQPVKEVDVEVKAELDKQEQFDKNLALGDEIIEGFTDTCLDTVEGIQRNEILSNERKMEKIAAIEEEFLAIAEDDIDALIIFFKKMHHEHHMLQNKLGEYDERVYSNGLINDARISNYDIISLHLDDELYHYESRDDKNAINKLLDMAEEIHRRANACGCLDKYLKETESLLMTCHTRLDIDVVEEKFDSMLMDLNVELNMSNNTLIG